MTALYKELTESCSGLREALPHTSPREISHRQTLTRTKQTYQFSAVYFGYVM